MKLEDVAKVFLSQLPSRLVDLLEIASYVYTADAATERGGAWGDAGATEPWQRDFRFVIPVRDVEFWNQARVNQLLAETLSFLSDDRYLFDFCELTHDRAIQEYLDLGDEDEWPFKELDRVVMFSGGLDSLAGAVESAASGHNLVLVSHRPVSTVSRRQRKLVTELRRGFPRVRILHVPVWVYKAAGLGNENSQRTRSFLYASLGATVGATLLADGVRFFENGVVSLNLPIADEVVRARASRTTHPLALSLMTELLSRILERPFIVDNPYLFRTKADIVSVLSSQHVPELIGHTVSCIHTVFKSKSRAHCGLCSQCIDRRIAVVAAGEEIHDPETDYVEDVFLGARSDRVHRNMAVNYVRHATELDAMTEDEIASRFNLELTRAVRGAAHPSSAASRLIAVHKAHARTVCDVLTRKIGEHAADLLQGRVHRESMLSLVAAQVHHEPTWDRFADRIAGMLDTGVRITCQTHAPRDEPHLQEICDGILKAGDTKLRREFPFMRWASRLTKPDWSTPEGELWVELKYVRKSGSSSNIVKVLEAIAADITKYGDNRRKVLFIVYDPDRIVRDAHEFGASITAHAGMRVHIIK